MSSINGRGYDVVDIANWFHNLPHLGKDLKQISNTTFDYKNEQYVTSLVVYLALPIAIMVMILVLYFLVTIILCCCCKGEQKRKGIRIECKVFIFLFGLVCGLSFISGLYGDWQLYQGVKSVESTSKDVVNWLDQIKGNSTKLLDQTFNIGEDLKSLAKDIKDLEVALPPEQLDKYIDYCNRIIDYIEKTNYQVKDANKTLTDAKFDELSENVDKYGTLFCIISVCVLSTIAIIGLVFTFAICCRCVLGCFTILAVIAFILSSVLLGTTLGVSVGGSDFCLDNKHWMRSLVNKDVSDYLIDCTSNNKVDAKLNEAQDYIKNAIYTNQDLRKLNTLLNQNCLAERGCPQDTKKSVIKYIDKLDSMILDVKQLVLNIMDLAHCQRINKYLNDTLDTVCTDGIKGVVLIFFNTIVAALCFAIIIFSATIALR